MASVNRTRSTATLRRKSGRFLDVILTLLIPGLFNRGIATAADSCGASFLFPTSGHEFYHLETINVTFQSSIARPTLSCFCGRPGRASEKVRIDHASPSGSELVLLNFSSTDPCWFELRPDSGECGDSSPTFILWPNERSGSSRAIIDLRSTPETTSTATAIAATIPAIALAASATSLSDTPATAVASPAPPRGGNELSAGAKAGLGIGIAVVCIAAGAMASFLYFRRRKKGQGADLADAIINRERRHGHGIKYPMARSGAESVTSGRSDEPLYPIQPVYDGFPGSTGYDDIRSLHSMDPVSPAGGHSPHLPHATTYWTDRDELSAARLKSQPIPIVTSYGPNPVTPTLTPRPSSRTLDLNIRAGSISTDSREGIPPMPAIPLIPDPYNYIPHSTPGRDPSPSPPRNHAQPIITSYGPNRVTPTPAMTTPTVPPDESLIKRYQAPSPAPRPITAQDRSFSWELDDSEPSMAAAANGPLPPYASTTDYYAMEKGAIRKLGEPQAEAELPPTKDGFYPYLAPQAVEHELPGAAPQNEPQLPYNPHVYKRNHPEAGPSGGGGLREIDEQKFLLSSEVLNMRAQKVKKRGDDESEGEEYDLGERRR